MDFGGFGPGWMDVICWEIYPNKSSLLLLWITDIHVPALEGQELLPHAMKSKQLGIRIRKGVYKVYQVYK